MLLPCLNLHLQIKTQFRIQFIFSDVAGLGNIANDMSQSLGLYTHKHKMKD